MSSLTETAYYTRKTIKFVFFGLVAIIILKISWTLFINYWIATHPLPPPPPNMAFGKLQYPKFPKEGTKYDYDLKLETVTGGFPESSSSAKVFFMPILSGNLLSLDRAVEKARVMGFNNSPISLTPDEYLWSDPQNSLRTMTINIIDGNLVLTYDYRQDQQILIDKNLPTVERAISEAQDLLGNYGLIRHDILISQPIVTYLKFDSGMLSRVGSLSDADFVRLDYQRISPENTRIATPGSDQSLISIILSGSNDSIKRVVDLRFRYQMVDWENFATYSVKTPSVAWEELKNQKGYIANPGTDPNKQKVIRNVYLVYYDSLSLQTYLEPVYLFQGDKDFTAYVPAIIDEWLEPPAK